MSLTREERAHVLAQLVGCTCAHCCCGDFHVCDDSITPMTEWGVGGAYVVCDNCERELEPTAEIGKAMP